MSEETPTYTVGDSGDEQIRPLLPMQKTRDPYAQLVAERDRYKAERDELLTTVAGLVGRGFDCEPEDIDFFYFDELLKIYRRLSLR